MNHTPPSCRYLPQFVVTIVDEVGQTELQAILGKAGLPGEWTDPEHIRTLKGVESAKAYAGLQGALRTYFGRGARGTLIRTGRVLWKRLLLDAPFSGKIRAGFVSVLPGRARLQPALKVLGRLLGSSRGDITVHEMDLDLLVVDHISPGTLDQTVESPMCFVTLGLLHACLHWVDGLEHDIEETNCRAMGGQVCEFKMQTGSEKS